MKKYLHSVPAITKKERKAVLDVLNSLHLEDGDVVSKLGKTLLILQIKYLPSPQPMVFLLFTWL